MKKKKVIAIVEANLSGFTVYSNQLPGFVGGGQTVEDAKRELKEQISAALEGHEKKGSDAPAFLNNGALIWVYKYNIESILTHLPIPDRSKLIKDITSYTRHQSLSAPGLALASEKQIQRIQSNLHAVGRKLLSVRL